VGALDLIESWGVEHHAAAVLPVGGPATSTGETDRPFRIASVAKLLTAYAAMVAVEEGAIELADSVGPPGATVAHLLAHCSGYGFEGDDVVAPPATRRVYSNRGVEVLADHVARAAGMPFEQYLREAVLDPLGMSRSQLRGSPAHHIWSTAADLGAFVAELQAPRLLAEETVATMVAVQFPGLPGVLPGVGRFDPLDWGFGFERNFGRPGHWAGEAVSTSSFGHFGGSGTFLWVDPVAGVGCICLTDRDFGDWALQVWPPFCTAVVRERQDAAAVAESHEDAERSTT
jgi:CubicO group peptidase (beta-lactamase class C family)